MNDDDPVDRLLDELRATTEGVRPPDGFDDRVWLRLRRAVRQRSPWLALAVAAAAAAASFVLANSSDMQLADQVLAQGDDATMETP